MITQVNTFVCEACGVTATTSANVGMYSDPVVCIDGWGYRAIDDKLCCPKCLMQEANAVEGR